MSNLIGGPIPKWVQKQIERRQKTIGNNPEVLDTFEERMLHNNRTSWVRMVSSAQIMSTEEAGLKIQENLGLGFVNSSRKDFQLFGGVNFSPSSTKGGIYIPNTTGVNVDIGNFTEDKAQYSYGLGETERGFQPIFGIDSVKVRHINRGALRRFDVRLRAFNKQQLDIIETLYMRLGFYMLLEWGHTKYIDVEGNLVTSPERSTPAYTNFLAGTKTDNDIVDDINDYRKLTGGNYDGALFIVDNYNWNLESDGSYSINILGISKGGLIDSLLLNYPSDTDTPLSFNYIIVNVPNETKKDILGKLKKRKSPRPNTGQSLEKHYSNIIFDQLSRGNFDNLKKFGAIQTPDPFEDQPELTPSFEGKIDNDNQLIILNQRKSELNRKLFEYYKELKAENWVVFKKKKRYKELYDKDLISIKFDNPNNSKDGYAYSYIKLRKLLDDIREILKSNRNNVTIPVDNVVNNNFMFTHWFQHSIDPRICLIPFKYLNENDEEEQLLGDILGTTFREEKSTENSVFQGKIMNMHINMEFIAQTLKKVTKPNSGDINLYEFLDNLLASIQGTLGGINNFNLTYVEESDGGEGDGEKGGGGLIIYDDTVIPGVGDQKSSDDNEQTLKLFGVNPESEGSFVLNLSTQSKISSEFATQITIGSVAGGINNSTSLLSRWNEGLNDVIQQNSNLPNNENSKTLLENIQNKYEKHLEFIKNTYVDFKNPPNNVTQTAQSNLKYLLEYDLAVKTVNGEIAGKGFIPIDLSIELEGISGILLFQRLKVSEEVLPYSYSEKVNFIVQAMDHTIANNKWTTAVTTLSVPKRTNLAKKIGTGGFSLKDPLPNN